MSRVQDPKNLLVNCVHRYVSNDFTLRASAVDATEVVRKMQTVQDTYPLSTLAVGRSMIGALLMASHLKEGQEVGVLIKSSGPIGNVYAEASFEGKVRGYTPHTYYQAPATEDQTNLSKAIGNNGTLTVVRHLPFQKQPHQGTVKLISGEIGDDIAYYLEQSHQIRSLISLGVYLDTYGKVVSAGGILIEVMPGVEEEMVQKLEANYLKADKNISKQIQAGKNLEDIIKDYFIGIPYTQLPHNHPVEYFCPCTVERVISALSLLGKEELADMIDKNESAETTCQMCGKKYDIPVEELQKLKDKIHRNSLH